MKIRKIIASTSVSATIPYPFNTYYEILSDAEIEDETGMPAHPSPCEECEGYAIEHLAYVKAKPEYEDVLLNNGLDLAELIRDTDRDETYLAYVVGDRIYSIDESDLPEEADDLYDRDTVMEAISDEFGIDDYDAYMIYDWYAEEGTLDDFESIDEFIEYVSDDIYDMLDAADDEEAKQRILDAIESSTRVSANQKVEGAIDTGLEYWYFTRHGLGPGMMPKGVNVVDTYEEDYKTWFKTDKLLTTEELNEYEIKEEWPPEGAVTHNGDVIESCTDIKAAAFKSEYATYYDPISKQETVTKRQLDKGVNRGPQFFGNLNRFEGMFYEDFLDSYDETTPLDGWCMCVGYDDDEEGHYWRCFSKKNWEKVKDLTDEEIYNTYKPAPERLESVNSSSCKKVSEDDKSIDYVVSSTEDFVVDFDLSELDWREEERKRIERELADEADAYDLEHGEGEYADIEGTSIVNYHDYKLFNDPNVGGWEVRNPDHTVVKSGFKSEKLAKQFVDTLGSIVLGAEEIEEEEDLLDLPEQEFKSEATAINGPQGKLPAAFKVAKIPQGALVLDYGGGKPEAIEVAQNFLDQFDAEEILIDPFNQPADHNRAMIAKLQKAGGADVAVFSNVLNVIKEPEARKAALERIQKLLKPGAICYITVYEGGGSGEGAATQKGKSYQNKRKLVTYLDEIQEVFPEAVKKGSAIVAPNTGKQSAVGASINLKDIDLFALENEIKEGIREYFASPEGGWPEDELDQAVADYSRVEIQDSGDHIVVQVRAELSYEGMMNLSEILDLIVQQYDDESYFEQVTPGIMEAYIWDNSVAVHASEDTDAVQDIKGYDFADDRKLDIDFGFEFDIDIRDGLFTVMPDTDDHYNDPLNDTSDYVEDGLEPGQLKQDFLELIYTVLPEGLDGKYNVVGQAHIVYDYDSTEGWYDFDPASSTISGFGYSPVGITAATDDPVAMTEEDLDYAIENGKPFDIGSFKKYKTYTDPDAIVADKVEVGDVISIDESADQVDLGTIVKVLAINDPAEKWIEYTFRCEVIQNPSDSRQTVQVGDTIDLYFYEDEPVGHLIPM